MCKSCFVEIQYKSTIPYHAHGKWYCTLYVLLTAKYCTLFLEINSTKIYVEIYIKIRGFFIQTIMSFSRNVNLDKMSACHDGHERSADCNVGQAGSVHYHGDALLPKK